MSEANNIRIELRRLQNRDAKARSLSKGATMESFAVKQARAVSKAKNEIRAQAKATIKKVEDEARQAKMDHTREMAETVATLKEVTRRLSSALAFIEHHDDYVAAGFEAGGWLASCKEVLDEGYAGIEEYRLRRGFLLTNDDSARAHRAGWKRHQLKKNQFFVHRMKKEPDTVGKPSWSTRNTKGGK
jgi:hypothetical protein